MEYIISVSEPWDFESPDGQNIIKGKLNIISEKSAIFKANYEIELEQIKSNILIIRPRYENESFKQLKKDNILPINAGILNSNDIKDISKNEITSQSVFVIVGTLKRIDSETL